MADFTPVVLMAMANDSKHSLRLAEEERILRELLSDAHDTERVEFQTLGHTILEDIFKSLNRFHRRVTIFHYCGHSGSKALLLEDGQASSTSLSKLLGMAPELKLVFLNGCSNQKQVEKLHEQGVKNVIATSSAIEDKKALDFSRHFYQSLAGGKTIKESFDTAAAFIQNKEPEFEIVTTRDFVFDNPSMDTLPWGLYYQEEEMVNWRLPLPEQLDETLARDTTRVDGGANMQLDETLANPSTFFDASPLSVIAVELDTTDRRVQNSQGTFRIEDDVLLGRSPECDIVILDRGVSRRHARIYKKEGQMYLADQNSTNGTYWNNNRVSQMPFREDGLLRLDEVLFKVRMVK